MSTSSKKLTVLSIPLLTLLLASGCASIHQKNTEYEEIRNQSREEIQRTTTADYLEARIFGSHDNFAKATVEISLQHDQTCTFRDNHTVDRYRHTERSIDGNELFLTKALVGIVSLTCAGIHMAGNGCLTVTADDGETRLALPPDQNTLAIGGFAAVGAITMAIVGYDLWNTRNSTEYLGETPVIGPVQERNCGRTPGVNKTITITPHPYNTPLEVTTDARGFARVPILDLLPYRSQHELFLGKASFGSATPIDLPALDYKWKEAANQHFEQADYDEAIAQNDAQKLLDYILIYPKGRFKTQAENHLHEQILNSQDPSAIRRYLGRYTRNQSTENALILTERWQKTAIQQELKTYTDAWKNDPSTTLSTRIPQEILPQITNQAAQFHIQQATDLESQTPQNPDTEAHLIAAVRLFDPDFIPYHEGSGDFWHIDDDETLTPNATNTYDALSLFYQSRALNYFANFLKTSQSQHHKAASLAFNHATYYAKSDIQQQIVTNAYAPFLLNDLEAILARINPEAIAPDDLDDLDSIAHGIDQYFNLAPTDQKRFNTLKLETTLLEAAHYATQNDADSIELWRGAHNRAAHYATTSAEKKHANTLRKTQEKQLHKRFPIAKITDTNLLFALYPLGIPTDETTQALKSPARHKGKRILVQIKTTQQVGGDFLATTNDNQTVFVTNLNATTLRHAKPGEVFYLIARIDGSIKHRQQGRTVNIPRLRAEWTRAR